MSKVKNEPKMLAAATNAHDLLVNVLEFLDNGTSVHPGCDLHSEATESRGALALAIEDVEAEICRSGELYMEMLKVCDSLTAWNADKNGNGIGLEKICKAAKKASLAARGGAA